MRFYCNDLIAAANDVDFFTINVQWFNYLINITDFAVKLTVTLV